MAIIKKIDLYIFRKFIAVFVMTFLIVVFILLMQFLWKHFEDLVGKGIGWGIIAEFFYYAIVTLVPMALPLALLLASLMTFGNLGENFELNAMKSAGISLFRIIRPLIILVSVLSVFAFYFSNNILPVSQTKLYTLILSLKQKSPELDIPTGEFYNGINGVNVYVRSKDKGLLKDLMIYDFSAGFANASVMVADSGRIKFSEDKKYLLFTLYDGENFENLSDQGYALGATYIPYRRESFGMKEILLDFDSDFNRFDESILKDQQVSKNITQLSHSIDSVNKIIESRSNQQAMEAVHTQYFGRDRLGGDIDMNVPKNINLAKFNSDSVFYKQGIDQLEQSVNIAIQKAEVVKQQIEYNEIMLGEPTMYVRRHESEWHRKFTLSFACLIFFFIGAPLGAIIRKGGFGAPIVISVLMFIIYYIIDNTGYKMSREGLWEAYQGMWLSSFVLLPIGVFLTYKAAVDATIFNTDQNIDQIKKISNSILSKFKKAESDTEN